MNRREFYNSLSEETKQKIKACRTEAEMMKVLSDEMIELDPEQLDGVNGGCILMNCNFVCDKDESKHDSNC